jgi:hypothetical protein
MAPPSTAGTHLLFRYISMTRSPPCPYLAPCLQDLQSTIFLSPSSRSARRISSTLRQYVYTIRDRQRGPSEALIHFLRFLRFLRNLSMEIVRFRRVAGSGQRRLCARQESNRLPSLCSTQPHIDGFWDKPLPTSMERATCVPGDPVSHHHRLRAECTYSRTTRSCARSVLRERRSQCGVPQLALRA